MNSTHSDLAENWSGAEISLSKEREKKKEAGMAEDFV